MSLTRYTEEQIQEFIRCRDDVTYFIDTYVKVDTPYDDQKPLELYPHQAESIEQIKEGSFHVIGSARQCGTSSMLLAYALWYSVFNADRTTGLVSYRMDAARGMVRGILDMYDQLPDWMKPRLTVRNMSEIRFDNGCVIICDRAAPGTFKGYAISLLIWVEAAFSKDVDAREFWYSIVQIISYPGATCVIASSFPPVPKHNLFMEIYNGAIAGNNKFKPHTYKWWYVPGRTRAWKAQQLSFMGKEQWNTEFGLTYGKT